MTIAEARQFFNDLICERLAQIPPVSNTQPPSDILNVDDALSFLASQGCYLTRGSLYNATAGGKIPCRRIGKKLSFSRVELTVWVESKVRQSARQFDAALTIAASARRK